MDEIERPGRRALGEQRAVAGRLDVAPADVRYPDRWLIGQADDATGQQPQALMRAELFAGLRHQLHAEADAEDRLAVRSRLAQRVDQAELAQPRHAVAKRADARQDDGIGVP